MCWTHFQHIEVSQITSGDIKTIVWDKALFKTDRFGRISRQRTIWLWLILRTSQRLEHNGQSQKHLKVRPSWVPKVNSSSKFKTLPVSVSRNPLDALGKGHDPTLQHLIIFQRVSWDQISSTTLHLKKTLIYLIADVGFFWKCIHMFSNKLPYISRRYTCIWTGKSIHCALSENSISLEMSFMGCPWRKDRPTSRF